jgi:opine dehydrogenase
MAMQIKKIAVLGAGNGGYMSAADMSANLGFEVAIFDAMPGKLDELKRKPEIEILDIDSKPTGVVGKLSLVSENIADVIRGAQVILNPVPYLATETYAKLAAPYLEDGQFIIALGKGGASLTWARVIKESGNKNNVFLADCNTLPYGASRMSGNQVRMEARTENLMFASFPAKSIDIVMEVLQQLYPAKHGYTLRRGQNPLDTLLVDYNAITHTPPMVCNAARIETGDTDFHLFGVNENTPAVVNVMKLLDRERMALGEKLGLKQYTLEEEIKMVKWNRDGVDKVLPFYEAIHTPFLEVCEGPFTLNTRHLTEDVPYGLVTFESLGKILGVPTPIISAIITISEGLLDRDFRTNGRTVEALGLNSKWSLEEIKSYLFEGKVN